MTVFRVDARIYVTAYVKAETVEAAALILDEYTQSGEMPPECSLMFSDPEFPEVSIGPTSTFYGPAGDDEFEEV